MRQRLLKKKLSTLQSYQIQDTKNINITIFYRFHMPILYSSPFIIGKALNFADQKILKNMVVLPWTQGVNWTYIKTSWTYSEHLTYILFTSCVQGFLNASTVQQNFGKFTGNTCNEVLFVAKLQTWICNLVENRTPLKMQFNTKFCKNF